MTAKQFKEDIKSLKENGVLTECETYLLEENKRLKKCLRRVLWRRNAVWIAEDLLEDIKKTLEKCES